MKTLFLCAALLFSSTRALAQTPIFAANFDGDAAPQTHAGAPEYSASLPPFFVEGCKGRALLIGHLRSVRYKIAGNLSTQQGTVSLWVKPLGWSRDEALFHHFFTVPDARTRPDLSAPVFQFLLYKSDEAPEVFVYGMSGLLGGNTLLRAPMDDGWMASRWHHLALTWNSDEMNLYVDGNRRTMRLARPLPTALDSDEFFVGGPYFVKNTRLTALDDLMIFDRVLSAAEIAALGQ